MASRLFAIDPGPKQSAIVGLTDGLIFMAKIWPNHEVASFLRDFPSKPSDELAVEMVQSFGMLVGAPVFETCVWVGRFVEAWSGRHRLIYRKTIVAHLCGTVRAGDANVARAIRDRYPKTGGGKRPSVGTKKQPGPLYGFKSHLWSALAVAITARETEG